ncbi:MATE family efflux transporter [Chitinophagales bacterium]|nr:MATE family efflux transporter [Chitinophagales bacterium]
MWEQASFSFLNFSLVALAGIHLSIDGLAAYLYFLLLIQFIGSIQQSVLIRPIQIDSSTEPNKWQTLVLQIVASLIILIPGIWAFETLSLNLSTATLAVALSASYLFNDQLRKGSFCREDTFIHNCTAFIKSVQLVVIFVLILQQSSFSLSLNLLVLLQLTSNCLEIVVRLVASKKPKQTVSFVEFISTNWSFTKWLSAKALIQWFSGNYIILISAGILGNTAFSAIRIAQQVIGITGIALQYIDNSLPSKIASLLRSKGIQNAKELVRKKQIVFVASGLAISLPLLVWPNEILQLIYQKSNPEMCFAVICLSITQLVILAVGPSRYLLLAQKKTKSLLAISITTSVISIALSSLIISSYGLAGCLYLLFAIQLIQFALIELAIYYSESKQIQSPFELVNQLK